MSEGIEIDSIGGACPTQAYGRIDGKPFYFRYRYGRWTIDIDGANIGGGEHGDSLDGAMGYDDVTTIIQEAARRWRAKGSPVGVLVTAKWK